MLLLIALACATPAEEPVARLAPCPETPNCVHSQATHPKHAIEPLSFDGDVPAARERLKAIVLALPRTRLAEEDDDYLRFTFRTALLRFVDDVEFRLEADSRTIHVRSASRVGRGDLGVNRKRVERIREAWIRSE